MSKVELEEFWLRSGTYGFTPAREGIPKRVELHFDPQTYEKAEGEVEKGTYLVLQRRGMEGEEIRFVEGDLVVFFLKEHEGEGKRAVLERVTDEKAIETVRSDRYDPDH